MKKVYLLLGMAALLTACGGGKTETSDFTITGTLANNSLDGKEIYLQQASDKEGEYISIDTVTIENGTFKIIGASDQTTLQYITGEDIAEPILFVSEKGNIEITLDSTLTPIVKGTPLNNKLQEYINKRNSFNKELSVISQKAKQIESNNEMTPALEKEMDDSYNTTFDAMEEYTFNFTKENIENAVGQYIFLDRGRRFNADQLDQLISKVDESVKNRAAFTLIQKRYDGLKATAVGNTFVDLKGSTPEGNEIALSQYAGNGKVVLVDFWASWCPPCRKEMPHVVKIYQAYKDKGFEIVGVSLDNDKAAWKKGIKDLNITWPQMSDLKGWKTELGATYAVNSIPHMVLINKEGKIIERGINAEILEEKLKELL